MPSVVTMLLDAGMLSEPLRRCRSYLVHPQAWAFSEPSGTTYQCQALVLPLLFVMLEIYYSNSRKHTRSPQVYFQRKLSFFFLDRLDCQLGIEPLPFFNDARARQGVINATVFLQRSLEKRHIVGISSDVCRKKGDSWRRREGGEEFFRCFRIDVSEDYGCSSSVEETDRSGADAICAA
jgi:hypothetical protein